MSQEASTTKSSGAMEKKALARVTADEKQSWFSIAFIWIGTLISIPMLMVGAIFGNVLTLANIAVAGVVGFAIICTLMTLTGTLGSDLGLPSSMISTKAFGDKGASYVMSVVMFIGNMGWFGIQTATCASAFGILLQQFGINFPFWLGCIIWGAVMLVTAVYGFGFMKWLNYIAVPLLVIMCVYGIVAAISRYPGNWAGMLAYRPETPMAMSAAISTSIGLMANGTVVCSDYARYAKNRTSNFLSSFVGVLPAAILMLMTGSIMSLGTGETDITVVFSNMGMPVIAMLVLILATWTTNTGNAYSVGLNMMKIGNFKESQRPLVTMVCGIVGVIMAIAGLANAMEGFIGIISSVAPPITGAIIADYWILGKGKKENWYRNKGVNWIGVIAWACGGLWGLFVSFFNQALESIAVSLIVYLVLYLIAGKTKLAGQGPMPLPGEEGDTVNA